MPYIIDGHNLIGKLPGISLSQIDDEEQLIRRLGAFCARSGKKAEVYFDRAAPGHAGRQRSGPLTAVFVQRELTADEAIRRRLKQLGRQAKNWTVVSSDRQVQAEARAAGARVLLSEDFADLLDTKPSGTAEKCEPSVSDEDLAWWLDQFRDEGTDV